MVKSWRTHSPRRGDSSARSGRCAKCSARFQPKSSRPRSAQTINRAGPGGTAGAIGARMPLGRSSLELSRRGRLSRRLAGRDERADTKGPDTQKRTIRE